MQHTKDHSLEALVGDDAHAADKMVREAPEQVYEADFRAALRKQFT